MAQLNGLPVFYIKIDEDLSSDLGINFVSLVDCPAIEKNWVAMSDKAPLKFSADKDKQLLAGPIMIPDMPIYRYDHKMGEYYVVFTKTEIEKLVRKFQAQQKTINLNYMHQKDSQLKAAVIQEIWLTGKVDKSQTFGFSDLPEGSAFVVSHIGDSKFWNDEVKSGNVQGFSIEGFLDMEMKRMGKKGKFDVVERADSNDLYIIGSVEVGNVVYSNASQKVLIGDQVSEIKYPCWETTVALKDGRVLVLESGKIIEIKEKMSNSKFITAKTKEGVEIKSDSEAFTVGAEVYTEAEGVKTPAPNGQHTLENGEVITVQDGKITEVLAPETEETAEEIIQKAVEPLFAKMRTALKAATDKIAELEVRLANVPGAASASNHTDPEVKLTSKQVLLNKLEILKKKNTEVTKK